MNHNLSDLIGAFPLASAVRKIESKTQVRFNELRKLTGEFICKELKTKILTAQENDCEGCTSKFTTFFLYPEFLKLHTERQIFIKMLNDTLVSFGYSVYEETDGAREPTGTVIVTWRENQNTLKTKHSPLTC
jgi:hypothetical protein